MSYFARRSLADDEIQMDPCDGNSLETCGAGSPGAVALTHEGTHASEPLTPQRGLVSIAKDFEAGVLNQLTPGIDSRTLLIGAAVVGALYFMTRKKRR